MLDATGTVTALNSVEIRPQIASTITKVHIREGQFVTAGQPLFTLDARNDEVNVTKARAQLAKDLAALADAQRQLARSKDLFAQNFISQGAVDTNQTLVDSQQAVVAADRAAIEAAQVGAVVQPDHRAERPGGPARSTSSPAASSSRAAPPLVTITQLDPIAVAFSLPQRNLGEALAALRGGGGKVDGDVARRPAARSAAGCCSSTTRSMRARARCEVKAEFAQQGRAALARRLRQRPPGGADAEGRERRAAGGDHPERRAARSSTSSMRPPRRRRGRSRWSMPRASDAAVSGVKPGERVVLDGRQNLRPGVGVIERAPVDGAARGRRGGAASAASGASGGASGPPAAVAPAVPSA